jgi:flavin reductase (DIM6/NTAB) family NADH-FMN oxidoreductase RutF
VVTSGAGPRRTGATVTTAHSLSLEPEAMVVSLNVSSSTYAEVVECGFFCVNVLAADQQDVAERFSGRGGLKGADRYAGAGWRPLRSGALALADALANVDCEVEEILLRHSHALIIGRVCAVEIGGAVDGLVYRAGSYGAHVSRGGQALRV